MIAKEESKSAWYVLSTTLPTRSQDYFSSSYPNTVKFSLKRKANCARCVLAATLPTRCSRDYFSSSYPNTIKFDKNVLRWRKSNSIFEPSASKLVAFPRLPLRSSQDSIDSFASTKGGALWIGNVLIGLSRSAKKRHQSLTFSISALFIARLASTQTFLGELVFHPSPPCGEGWKTRPPKTACVEGYFEIWPAVRMSQMLHWIRFIIRGNSEYWWILKILDMS